MKASDSSIAPGDLIKVFSLFDAMNNENEYKLQFVLSVDRLSPPTFVLHLIDEFMNYHKVVLYDLSIVDVVCRFCDCL